jgi:hypothetical protein
MTFSGISMQPHSLTVAGAAAGWLRNFPSAPLSRFTAAGKSARSTSHEVLSHGESGGHYNRSVRLAFASWSGDKVLLDMLLIH